MTFEQIRPHTMCAWNGSSLLITNTMGACDGRDGLLGYYFRETRFARLLQFEINGTHPWLCEAAAVDPATLTFTYAYPEAAGAHEDIPQRAVAIVITYTAHVDGLSVHAATVFTYQHARLHYRSSIDLSAHGQWRIDDSHLTTRLGLEPHDPVDIGLRITAPCGRSNRRRGPFRLLQQPPPESLSAGIGDRLRALFRTSRQ